MGFTLRLSLDAGIESEDKPDCMRAVLVAMLIRRYIGTIKLSGVQLFTYSGIARVHVAYGRMIRSAFTRR